MLSGQLTLMDDDQPLLDAALDGRAADVAALLARTVPM